MSTVVVDRNMSQCLCDRVLALLLFWILLYYPFLGTQFWRPKKRGKMLRYGKYLVLFFSEAPDHLAHMTRKTFEIEENGSATR